MDSPMCVPVTGEEQPCTQLAEEGLAQKVKQGACAWEEHLLATQRPVVPCILVYGLVKQNIEYPRGVDTSHAAKHLESPAR